MPLQLRNRKHFCFTGRRSVQKFKEVWPLLNAAPLFADMASAPEVPKIFFQGNLGGKTFPSRGLSARKKTMQKPADKAGYLLDLWFGHQLAFLKRRTHTCKMG
jgi:hypothetical protein